MVLKFGEEEARGTVEVRPDPRVEISMADRQANWAARQRAGAVQEVLADALTRIVAAGADADATLTRIQWVQQVAEAGGTEFEGDDDKPFADLKKDAEEFKKELGELEGFFRTPAGTKGITGEVRALEELQRAGWYIGSSRGAPSSAVLEHLGAAEELASAGVDSLNAFMAGPYEEFRAKVLAEEELQILGTYPALEMPTP